MLQDGRNIQHQNHNLHNSRSFFPDLKHKYTNIDMHKYFSINLVNSQYGLSCFSKGQRDQKYINTPVLEFQRTYEILY